MVPTREARCDQAVVTTPRLTTCFDDLAAALRAWAKGLFTAEAAVELLIGHRSWLYREEFLEIAVEFGREITGGAVLAAAAVLHAAGHRDLYLPTGGERR